MENFNLPDVLTALFTLLTAIATWCSYCISKKLLKFQKNFSKNEPLIRKIQNSIAKLREILLICNNPQHVSDEVFLSYETIIDELNIDFINYENSNILKVNEISIKYPSNTEEIKRTISRLENIIDNLL